jgi:hypothetical protein
MSFLDASLLSDSITTVENIYDYIEKSLEEPDDVYNQLEEVKQKEKLKNIKPILEVVENFIMRRKGLLYGGTALNFLLPSDLKFYGPYEIPDYDFFHPDAGTLAKEIADELYSQGYKYTEVKNALHEGTYKVYSNFESVADVTEVPTSAHRILLRGAKKVSVRGRKLPVSPVNFLKAMAYKELCMPISSAFRWSKVYRRLLLLERAYPLTLRISKTFKGDSDDVFSDDLLPMEFEPIEMIVRRFVANNSLVYIGGEATYHYLKKHMDCAVYVDSVKRLRFLSTTMNKTAKDLIKMLKRRNKRILTKMECFEEFSIFLPRKCQVWVKLPVSKDYVKVATIYDASDNCYSIVPGTISNSKSTNISKHVANPMPQPSYVCSIFFMYYIIYLKTVIYPRRSVYASKVDKLTLLKLSETFMNNDEGTIFKTFTTDCYGNKMGQTAVKKSIWDKKKKILYYRPGD